MGRSPGFGSITCNYYALLRLGFPAAPYLLVLNLATYDNSPDRSTKSTPSNLNVLRLLVNIGFQVLFHSPPGVLFTFPSRYCFTIGHRLVFRLGRWSSRLPTRFLVSRGTLDTCLVSHLFAYGIFTLFDLTFQLILLRFVTIAQVRNPRLSTLTLVWPFPHSLATTNGISFDFFSCGYLDVSVPHVPFRILCIYIRITKNLPLLGFPIRTSMDRKLFASPHSLSQLIASFIGFRCQGIHPMLLVA